MAKQPVMRAVTLGDLARAGRTVWAYCLDCFRERDLTPAKLPLPTTFAVPDVGKRLKCSACGSRRIQTKPQLHDKPIDEIRARRRRRQHDQR